MYRQAQVERILTPVGTSGDNVIYLCPSCGDTSGHLYVNYRKGKYHCVRCGQFKGSSINKLLRDLGQDVSFDYEELETPYSKGLSEALDLLTESPTSKREVDYSNDLYSLNVYYDYHTKELSYEALNYLFRRGFTEDYVRKFKLREGLNRSGEVLTIKGKTYVGRDYSGRIMIPSLFPDGSISFYLGRDYTGTKSNKYSNAPQELAYSSEDVWSINLIDSQDVIICEGVFTAMSVNLACNSLIAVATYGKSIASKSNTDNDMLEVTSQGEKLLRRRFKTYYVFYDKDAVKDAMTTMKYLHDRGAKVKYVEILTDKYGEKADAADMTNLEILECLRNAKDYNDFLELGL